MVRVRWENTTTITVATTATTVTTTNTITIITTITKHQYLTITTTTTIIVQGTVNLHVIKARGEKQEEADAIGPYVFEKDRQKVRAWARVGIGIRV